MPFDGFDESTSFDAHKGSDPEPKRHRAARKKAEGSPGAPGGTPKAAPPARPQATPPPKPPDGEPTPPPRVPEPSGPRPMPSSIMPIPPGVAADGRPQPPAPRKKGAPPTGNWPARAYKPKNYRRGRSWAESDEWMPFFIKAMENSGNTTYSAAYAGVSYALVKNRRNDNADFAKLWEDALHVWRDRLRGEVCHRAVEGEDVWIYDKVRGELVYGGKRKSDLLLMFQVKRDMPEYRDTYKDESQGHAEAKAQAINVFLGEFKPPVGDQIEARTFDQLLAEQGIARGAIPPPEPAADRRARLVAELAALDAEADATDEDAAAS